MSSRDSKGKALALVMLFLVSACSAELESPPEGPEAGTDVATDAGNDAGKDDQQDAGRDGGPGTDADAGTDGGTSEPFPFDLQLGGAHDDEFLDVVVAEDAVYVAGYRRGSPGTFVPSGDSDGVVLAFNRHNGEGLWKATYALEGTTESADALIADGETLIVVGRTSGAYAGFTHAGKTDLVVSRLHKNGGTVTPLIQFGDERPQHGRRVVLDGRGEIVIAGLNDTWIPSNYVEAWEDTLLARISFHADENAFASRSLVRSDSGTPDAFYGLAAYGAEGDVIVSGAVQSGASRGPIVRRLGPDGELRWSRTLTDSPYDAATAVAIGPEGHVYVAGSSFRQFGERHHGQMDAFVVVLDATTGGTVRAMQAGTSESEWVRDLAVDSTGNVWVAGGTLGALPGFGNAGDQDAFVVRFDSQGRWTSSWQHGSPAMDEVNALALHADGNVYLVGQTDGAFAPGSSFNGGRDGFLRRVANREFVSVD